MIKTNWLTGMMLAGLSIGGTLQGGIADFLPFSSAKSQAAPDIAVLIAHDVPGVVLEVKGKYRIFDPHTQEFISTRFVGKRKFVQAMSNGIRWGEEFPSVHQIQIVPDDARTSILVDGIEYKGVITVFDIGGTISVVNDLPIDDYVRTILNPIYSSEFPEEFAAALVIAERTDALYSLHNSASQYFNVDREKVNYLGNAAAERKDGFAPMIQSTRNMIMVKEGAPFAVNLFAKTSTLGNLSFSEAIALANQGNHAAQILSKAFPGSSVRLMNSL